MTTDQPQLTTHQRGVALTTLMLTLAQELRAAKAGLEAAAIEHYKLTRDPLYLGCLVWQEGDSYRVRIIDEFLAKLPLPPNPIEITPVTVTFHMGHVALPTGTVERFEEARKQAEREQVLTP